MKYHKVSNIGLLTIFLLGLSVYIIFDYYDETGRGFVAALSVGAMLSLIVIVKDIAHGPKFWIGVSVIALAHAVLIAALPWGHRISFGILATPLVVADMYISGRFLILLQQFGGHNTN